MNINTRNGATLVIVSGLMMLGVLMAGSVALSTGNRMGQVRQQFNIEAAFYLAEAGAERAVSRIAAGNETPGTLSGSLGRGSFVSHINVQSSGGESQINITSTGTVQQVTRVVSMRGIRRVSWARYALWYQTESTSLWIAGGEKFRGPVYSTPQFRFHSYQVSTLGQTRFYHDASSVATSIQKENTSVNPIFDVGLSLGVPSENMSSIVLASLKTSANLVLDGASTIIISNQTLRITNLRRGWTNFSWSIPDEGVVYVQTVTSGDSATRTGDLSVSGPSGLHGRLTLVADRDILINNHITYAENPQTLPSSTDALGLIARRHVAVQASAPNDLNIYAHIICGVAVPGLVQEGGFGVANYNTGSYRGLLTVYGGIVNYCRNPVGQVSGTGYTKNYTFDTRFSKTPPPCYPIKTDEFEWTEWDG
jgi:hypothetical protein